MMILLAIIYLIVDICAIIWICSEASEREGASAFKAFVFTFFFTPITGLLYLLLYPKTLYVHSEEQTRSSVEANVDVPSVVARVSSTKHSSEKSFEIGDIVLNTSTSETMMIADINKDGTYKCMDKISHKLIGNFTIEQIKK